MHCMLRVISRQNIWSLASDVKGPCQSLLLLHIHSSSTAHFCSVNLRTNNNPNVAHWCFLSLHKSSWGSWESYPCRQKSYYCTQTSVYTCTRAHGVFVNPVLAREIPTVEHRWTILLEYCWTQKLDSLLFSLTCTKSHLGSSKSCPFAHKNLIVAHWYFSFLHKSIWVIVNEVAILGMMYAIVGYIPKCAVIGFFSVQWRVQPWRKWKTMNSLDLLVVGHNFTRAYHICTFWKLGLFWPT
jgi:hypothetical protein